MLATLADTAGAYLLYRSLPPDRRMTSIEFKLNFLRPAVADAGELHARARIVKQGRQVTLCDIEVAQGGELVAKGLFLAWYDMPLIAKAPGSFTAGMVSPPGHMQNEKTPRSSTVCDR